MQDSCCEQRQFKDNYPTTRVMMLISNYKNCITYKGLVVISPEGVITYSLYSFQAEFLTKSLLGGVEFLMFQNLET